MNSTGSISRPLIAERPPELRSFNAGLSHVSKTFNGNYILRDVNLAVSAGDIILVKGPSGSGKSTALRILAGIERPDTGFVWLSGRRLDMLSGRARVEAIQRLGLGFQDPLLDNALTVFDNLTGLARAMGRYSDRNAHDVDRAGWIADMLQLSDRLHDIAAVLSGGQKLRLALGRALIGRPDMLILDEPTHMVDATGKSAIFRMLGQIIAAERLAAVIASHDDEATQIATRAVSFNEGRLT